MLNFFRAFIRPWCLSFYLKLFNGIQGEGRGLMRSLVLYQQSVKFTSALLWINLLHFINFQSKGKVSRLWATIKYLLLNNPLKNLQFLFHFWSLKSETLSQGSFKAIWFKKFGIILDKNWKNILWKTYLLLSFWQRAFWLPRRTPPTCQTDPLRTKIIPHQDFNFTMIIE